MYETWVNSEYDIWVKELSESSIYDFKDKPQVRRMLSLDADYSMYAAPEQFTGINRRYYYYSKRILKELWSSIAEIGGGYGGMCEIMNILCPNKLNYSIYDIPEVQKFQNRYLRSEGIEAMFPTEFRKYDFLISMYCLGELPKKEQERYMDLVGMCRHGLIIWNPHFEPDDASIIKKVKPKARIKPEDPLTSKFNLEITW